VSDGPVAYAVPLAVEIAGMFLVSLGIAIEVSTGADLGYAVISTGSAMIAGGSVLWAKILGGRRKRGR